MTSSNFSLFLLEVSNSTSPTPQYHLWKLLHPKFVFYSCLMILTIISNSYVIYVVLRHKSNFRSWRLNLFLVHLAVAGLLVSITTMPATLISIPTDGAWIFGDNLCKVKSNPIRFLLQKKKQQWKYSVDQFFLSIHFFLVEVRIYKE